MNSHLFLLALNAWLTQLNMAEEWSFEELCCWLAEPDTTHPKTMGQEHFVTVFARRMALIQKLTSHGTMTKDHLDQLFALLARQLP